MNATDLIQRFNMVREDRTDGEFYVGRTGESFNLAKALADDPDWFCESDFCQGFYRTVWICLRDRLTVTYAEGDLRLQLFPKTTAVEFYKSLLQAAEFYAEQ